MVLDKKLLAGARKLSRRQAGLMVVATVLVGVTVVYTIRAAGTSANLEVETGSIAAPAVAVSPSGASGGGAVQFGSGATPTPTPSTSCALPNYPNASCTGVPAGTALTNVAGDLVVMTDSAVVDSKNVSGCIDVRGVGVTVKNSKARCITTTQSTRARNPANPRLTVQDSEVNCGNVLGSTAIGDVNINVYRVNIHGCENGFDMDSDATITDSYIHDLYNAVTGNPDTEPHTDGLQSGVGNNLLIDHNTFYGFDTGCVYPNNGSCNGTSAINIFNAPSGPTVHDTTVSNNLLAGGASALYCPRVTTVNFKVLNNHFSRIYSPHVGEFDPSSDCSNETQSGNVIHETGQALTLG